MRPMDHFYETLFVIWLLWGLTYVTLDHKTSRVHFFENEIYASFESWINKLYIDVWFVICCYNIWPKYN